MMNDSPRLEQRGHVMPLMISCVLALFFLLPQRALAQTDARDYEAGIYLPSNTLMLNAYLRYSATSDQQIASQTTMVLRGTYLLKYGNIGLAPIDVIFAAANVNITSAATGGQQVGMTGISDPIYAPTIGYGFNEQSDHPTALAGTLYVTIPVGEYDPNRGPLNIGQNRWVFRPQLSIYQRYKILTAQLVGNVGFTTTNDDFRLNVAPAGAPPTLVQFENSRELSYGFEGHLAVDLSKSFYIALSYFLTANGKQNLRADLEGQQLNRVLSEKQTVQTVRLSPTIRLNPSSLLMLQYQRDFRATGGASRNQAYQIRFTHFF
ncbi:transporter [Archangium violaceum]|uniref:transporter n=1 Tax=Archangium violaceum TaxID=83451 RepID=UPI00194DF42F|nr:transporter [Archangium violaceum]QRN94455.1 transporter [Archangium violaceum]